MAKQLRLSNPHSVCYINSAIQLLSEVKLDDWGQGNPAGRFMNKIASIKQHGGCFSAWTEVNSFVDEEFRHTTRQGDAHEILLEILRCMHNDTLVNSLFGVLLITITKCLMCGNMSERPDLSTQLTVSNQSRSMNAFFTSFFVPETLKECYECERCCKADSKIRTTAEMSNRVKSWPPYLLVHILRFEEHHKINNEFQFPLVFIGADSADPEYVLDGAILHIGMTKESGHYACLGRIDDNSFYYYDDDKFPRITYTTDINSSIFKQQVYILLYRRRTRKI